MGCFNSKNYQEKEIKSLTFKSINQSYKKYREENNKSPNTEELFEYHFYKN